MRKSYLFAGLILILVLIGLLFRQSTSFHLVKTDPAGGSNPNQYAAVSYFFNQPISRIGQGLNQITITPNAVGKTTVGDKSVTFTPDTSYSVGTIYTAVLTKVTNAKGKTLTSLTLKFTPKYVTYSQLPNDVRQRLIEQTDIKDKQKVPYSADVIAIDGSTDLLNHGLTDKQLSNLKAAYFRYFQSKQQEVRGMKLTNIAKKPHDRNSSSTIDTITFTTTLDNRTVYTTKLEYSNLTTIRLYLYDSANGALIYDSNSIG